MRQVVPHVLAAGSVVLALEILGTRILGPFYGVSLYLWSALITVTLASLSLGYYVGGKVADRHPEMAALTRIFAAAGLWLVLLPTVSHPAIDLFSSMDLRAAVLCSSIVLFAVPLTLLGMVAPYAVRLATVRVESVGSTAGLLYALSTLASVVSALLTGFLLIPHLGISRLLTLLALLLLLTALYSLWRQERRTGPLVSLVAVLTLLGWLFLTGASDNRRDSVWAGQSPYAEIRVVDSNKGRYLLVDGTVHSLVDTVSWQSLLEYTAVMEIPRSCFEKPGRMLLIGLGAGSLAKRYSIFGWSVDVVEIDPTVIRIAKEYFNFSPETGTVYEQDGRRFILNTQDRYDVILLDAFGSGAIPFHLITQEAFGLLGGRLNPGGILAVNLWAQGWNDIIVKSVARTLKAEFRHVIALPISEPPDRLGNVVVLARDQPVQLVYELERHYDDPNYRYGPMYYRAHAWDNQFLPSSNEASLLTDDLNPVDIWSERINRESRKELQQMFLKMGIEW